MILHGDVHDKIQELEDQSIHCVITSPPYFGLRDYGEDGQIGLEETPEAYVNNLVNVFRGIWDKLNDEGTVWLNLGDSYNGSGKGQFSDGERDPKKKKTEGMKLSAAKVGGLKPKDLKRSVWTVNTKPFKDAHFAVFPEALIEPMVLAGCPKGGIVCDPFMGSGTTGVVAKKRARVCGD